MAGTSRRSQRWRAGMIPTARPPWRILWKKSKRRRLNRPSPQPRDHSAHVRERPLHSGEPFIVLDLVLQVEMPRVSHSRKLTEQRRNRDIAVAHIHARPTPVAVLAQVF